MIRRCSCGIALPHQSKLFSDGRAADSRLCSSALCERDPTNAAEEVRSHCFTKETDFGELGSIINVTFFLVDRVESFFMLHEHLVSESRPSKQDKLEAYLNSKNESAVGAACSSPPPLPPLCTALKLRHSCLKSAFIIPQ